MQEALWPYMREFADRAIDHVRTTLDKVAFAGRPCKLHLVHGHYSEAGEIASLIASVLDAPVCFTGTEHNFKKVPLSFFLSMVTNRCNNCVPLSGRPLARSEQVAPSYGRKEHDRS